MSRRARFLIIVIILLALALGGVAGVALLRNPAAQKQHYYENGLAAMKARQYSAAVIDFTNAVQLDKKFADAYYQLGLAQLALGQGRPAYEALVQATKLKPDLVPAHVALGELYLLAGADDVLLELAVAGAKGWIAGYPNALPKAGVALYRAAVDGDLDRALPLYKALHPLLRWDTKTEFVQAIKLSMDLMGLYGGPCRPPRLPLTEEHEVERSPDPESLSAADEERLAVRRLIAALPEEHREVLLLREMEDLSYREIASVTQVPIGTVMSRLARARAALRGHWLKEAAGEPHAVR